MKLGKSGNPVQYVKMKENKSNTETTRFKLINHDIVRLNFVLLYNRNVVAMLLYLFEL